MKNILCFIFLIIAFVSFSQPKTEVRAVWLTTVWNIDWPLTSGQTAQKQEMCNLLDMLKEANFNTIMFQVRARGDLLYPSQIEPYGKSMTGTLGSNPGWDVLSYVINEAHARGIEVHAWFVTYRVWDSSTLPPTTTPLHVLKSHPEYCKSYVEGTSTSWWLDPGIPAVRTYLRNIISEMVSNYNLDGIHFDYIRYPDASFDDDDTYALYGGGQNKDDWRRNNITQFVGEVYSDVQSVKPMLKVGSAPIGIYKNIPGQGYNWEAFYDVFQASRVWLNNGTHDYLCPQIYWDIATTPQFHVVLEDWMSESYGKHIYPGIAAYRMGTAKNKFSQFDNQDFFKRCSNNKAGWTSQEILNQVDSTRTLGAFGQTYFSTSDIDENVNNIHTLLKQNQYLYPANIPSMAWKDNIAPNAPQNLQISLLSGTNYKLTWTKPITPSDNDTVKYYNVYMSENYPIDISDIKNVIAFMLTDTTTVVDSQTSGNRYFLVTAYDKGYNESLPSNTVGSVTDVDVIPPETQILYSSYWQTNNFSVNFNDIDSGSGIDKAYYQVLDFNGSEWKANNNYGFYHDEFQSSISSDWSFNQGTWSISNQSLNQTDETNSNTNIYSDLQQNYGDTILYSWRMKISGSGTNLRAGIHFYCSDASQADRDDSYMVYFRTNGNTYSANTCQIYQYIDNVFVGGTFLQESACNILRDTWYEYKLIYYSSSGLLEVYQDNQLITSYTYTNPHTFNATGISFRTGNSNVFYDDLKVMKSRQGTVGVSVNQNGEVRFSNTNPQTPSCRIQTLLKDHAGNWTDIISEDINIDFSNPLAVTYVHDGLNSDTDLMNEGELITASWDNGTDTNSGIEEYLYCLGTSQGAADVIPWTSAGTSVQVTFNNITPIIGTTYYTSVKAKNNAGLYSTTISSDGITVISQLSAQFSSDQTTVCEGESVHFINNSTGAISYNWILPGGNPSTSTLTSPDVQYSNSGNYNVTLIAINNTTSDTTIISNYIQVQPRPASNFFANDTVLNLPSAIATFTNTSTQAQSYQWNFGDGSNSTDENPYHIYSQAGVYSVVLISSNMYCPSDTLVKENYITVSETSSVISNEKKKLNISVYPNPTQDEITIISVPDIEGKAFLMNIQGEILKIFELNKQETVLNLKNLADGIYSLKIVYDTGFIMKRIVKI